MSTIITSILFIFLGYISLAVFMYYFSFFFYYIGYYLNFVNYPLDLISSLIYPISPFVYLIYSSLIFVLLYKIFKSVFINKK